MRTYIGAPSAFFEVLLVSPPRTITVATAMTATITVGTAMTATIMVTISIPATAIAIKVSSAPTGPVSVAMKLPDFRLTGRAKTKEGLTIATHDVGIGMGRVPRDVRTARQDKRHEAEPEDQERVTEELCRFDHLLQRRYGDGIGSVTGAASRWFVSPRRNTNPTTRG